MKKTQFHLEEWNHASTDEIGMHLIISPEKSDCNLAVMYRLNMEAGGDFTLETDTQEMNLVLVKGIVNGSYDGQDCAFTKLDSLYLPGRMSIHLSSVEDSIFYIAACVCEGYGKPLFRKFDFDQPFGDIRSNAGAGSSAREVFYTIGPDDPASRLLCGFTFGNDGGWTSWPPHQHENDLEEVYSYFNIDPPNFGLHLAYTKAGQPDSLRAHVIHSGSMVLASAGYHPTVAIPGCRMSYFWALFAFSHKQRRYDIAITDPYYINKS